MVNDHRNVAYLHELYRIKRPSYGTNLTNIYIYKINVCLCEEKNVVEKKEGGGWGVGQDRLMYLHNSYANTRKASGSWELPLFIALLVCPIQIGNFCAIIFNIFTTPEKII